MPIDPGKMRDRVTLQLRGEPDPWTGSDGMADLATVWAEFRPQSGREFREGVGDIGEERATWLVNYRENLTQVDQLVHRGRGGNRVWDITSIQPYGFKDGLLLLAVARK